MAEIESDKSQAAPISGAADATTRESRVGLSAPAKQAAAKGLDEVMSFMRRLSAFEKRSSQVKLLVR